MYRSILPCLAGMLVVCASTGLTAPRGGIFIPRNGGYEGRIGRAHVFIDASAGGVVDIVTGEWPALERLARVEMVFAVSKPGVAQPVEVRQSFDRSPNIIFLEEGNDRIGVRVKSKLYDAGGVYHGHATTETWIYPSGEVMVTPAAGFEDGLAHTAVTAAALVVSPADQYATATPATDDPSDIDLASLEEPQRFALGDEALPGRNVLFSGGDRPLLGVYWRTGTKAHFTFIYREGGGAPTYYRWPDYLHQAYQGHKSPGAVEVSGDSLRFLWLADGATAGPKAVFAALIRVVVPQDADALAKFVADEREPVELTVEGGEIHGNLGGYNDLDGAYEVRKTGEPMTVHLPADPAGRTIRVKAVGISGHGAVVTTLDGESVVPQLVAEGGIADDPLAPIREQPEGPADTAIVTVKLGPEPRTLVFSEQEGVQLVYQTRDTWRSLVSFSSKGGGRWPGLRFSPVDGRVRNMRAHGSREYALTENLMTWFSFCGYTPEQMIDQLVDLEILKNGPDEAIFRYVSENANGRAQSEYIVRIPADSPAMQMNVTATFTVTEAWPYNNNQFFDVFPFRGVWPQDWWYANVLWLAPDGAWKTMDTVARTYDGDTRLDALKQGGFFALYSSERGNMVMLTKNFDPPLHTRYVICANYIDYHMEVKFPGLDGAFAAPKKGYQASVQYDLALWGDETATREQLVEIGNKSIKAGKLVLPKP